MSMLWMLACLGIGDGPMPMNDASGGFFDSPWPSQSRVTASGAPDLSGFPGRQDIALVGLYADMLETELDGASTNGPTYFRFQGPIDPRRLPDAAESLDAMSASVFVLNIDPLSPGYGETSAVDVDWQESATTYQPGNLLAVAPMPGAPLRPATTYAVVVTTDLAQQDPTLAAQLDSDSPDYTRWAELDALLFEMGRSSSEVAIATTFTTLDPVSEMGVISQHIENRLGIQELDQELELVGKGVFSTVYEGQIYVPLWQHGERPYGSEGGGFRYDEQGEPIMAQWELITMSVSIPNDTPPADGWPVMIYVHGTGGSWTSCCSGSGGRSPASRAAQAGVAVIGIAQPLHGDRATENTNVELHSFNLFNPESARANFRQGALDSVYIAHILKGRSHVFETSSGQQHTDPAHVVYMGHSQGGITGAMALPYLGDELDAAVLSGAGGYMSLSVLLRKQGTLDIEALVMDALNFSAEEEFDALHPVAALVQSLADVTDPINYAPFWNQHRTWFSERPMSVLMFQGTEDGYTPSETSDALSAAGGLSIIDSNQRPLSHQVLGLQSLALPVTQQVPTWGDDFTASGMASYPGEGHFVVFDQDSAADLYREFLESAVAGTPEITREFN